MKVTSETRTKIINALSAKGWNQSDLAAKLNRHRTWPTKLLSKNATIGELSEDLVDQLSDLLGISLNPIQTTDGKISTTALELSRIAETDPSIAALLEQILRMAKPEPVAFIPLVETKRLPKLGAKITEIVHRWEEGADPHYSKIAVEVLDFMRKFIAK